MDGPMRPDGSLCIAMIAGAAAWPARTSATASVQAATRVNAEQALYGTFEVKHIFYTILHFFPSFQFLCSTWNPVSSPRPTRVEADAHRACQGRPSLCPGRTLRRFQAAP